MISPLLLADEGRRGHRAVRRGERRCLRRILDHGLRESDFLLGYDSMLAWLPGYLLRLDVLQSLRPSRPA